MGLMSIDVVTNFMVVRHSWVTVGVTMLFHLVALLFILLVILGHVLLLKIFSLSNGNIVLVIMLVFIEERLDLDIALCHFMKNVRSLGFIVTSFMILYVPVLLRLSVRVVMVLRFMLIVLLFETHVARVFIARS